MTRTAAIGDGPVVFFSGGVQVEVPLSAIYFESNVVRTSRTDLPATFQAWISYLASRGRLIAGGAPLAKALKVTAAKVGSAGNDIQLKVDAKSAAGVTPVLVDVTVTETDRYEGLTLATLSSQLGLVGVGGTRLGLVTVAVNPAASATLPVAANPNVPLVSGAAATDPPTWTIAGTGAQAVTVQPRTPGAAFDAGTTKTLAITDVVAATGAFTLTATWSRVVPDVALTNVTAKVADLGYLVAVAPPDGETTITRLPRPGTVKLTGGSESVAATKASAIVMADG